MRRPRLLLAMTLLAACQPAPGRFSVTFSWEADAPSDVERAPLFVHARVEEREAPDVEGNVLASDVGRLDAPLSIDGVPNGTNRVVVVEIRTAAVRADGQLRYFGVSRPFDLEPGDDVVVDVLLALRAPPELLGAEVTNAADGTIADTEIMLRVRARDAARVQVAQDPQLTLGLVEVDSTADTTELTYDLDTDLDCARGACVDGLRQVFVRVVSAFGLFSEVRPVRIRLDSTAPVAQTVEINPPAARLDTTAVLTVIVDEPLQRTPELDWDRDPGFVFTSSSGLSYTFRLAVTGDVDEGTYNLLGMQLADTVGNTRAVTLDPPATLEVDSTAPTVTALQITPLRAKDDSVLTIDFAVDEVIAPEDVVVSVADRRIAPEDCVLASTLRCTLALRGALEPGQGTETTQPVLVEVADAAGNRGNLSGSVVFDFLAPAIVEGSVSAQLIPGAGLPVTQIGALTDTSTVRIALTLTEPVVSDLLTLHTDGLPFTLTSSAGTSIVFAREITAADPEGALAPELVAVDRAGNRAQLGVTLPTPVRVDRSAPLAPNVDASGSIVLRRTPWGAQATAGASRLELVAAAGAVEPDATVIVEHPTQGELVRLPAGTDGSFGPTELFSSDVETVRLTALDAAGNASPVRSVRDGTWRASLYNKVPGVTLQNPHELYVASGARESLWQNEAGPGALPTQVERVTTADGTPLEVTAERRWVDESEAVARPIQSGIPSAPELAYDAERGRVVLGPHGAFLAQTWGYDGRGWRDQNVALPPSRLDYGFAYDGRRARAVLFGGRTAANNMPANMRADVWEWDGATWTPRTPAPGPSARYGFGWAYHERLGVIVLHGGRAGNPNVSDTWTWDGQTWTDVTASGPRPTGELMMAYDPLGDRLVVQTMGVTNETWVWDGVTAWQQIQGTPSPPPRTYGSMVYDANLGAVLLYGGNPPTALTSITETWTFAGTTWSQHAAVGPPTWAPGLVHAPTLGGTLLFGGFASESVFDPPETVDDTWLFDGTRWVERSRVGRPENAPMAAYDTARNRLVTTFNGSPVSERSGLRWLRTTPAAAPGFFGGAISGPPAVYHEALGAMLFNSGVSGGATEVWSWNGTTWTNLSATSPLVGQQWATVYDRAQGEALYVRRNPSTQQLETWSYDGVWTQRSTTSPAIGATRIQLAFDHGRGCAVLLAADAPTNAETFEWCGSQWVLRQTGGAVPDDGTLAFDEARGRVVAAGRREVGGVVSRTSEWDGTTWTDVTPVGFSAFVQTPILVYDPDRRRISAFHASSGANTIHTLEPATSARPTALLQVRWEASGVAPADIEALQLHAVVGANGSAPQPGSQFPRSGVEALVWVPRLARWVAIGQHTAANPMPLAPTVPADLLAESVDAQGAMHFLLRPRGVLSGGAAPVLAIDHLELEVTYRRSP
ncbi:MAG: hypothetical protein RIT81_06600 [Deltaproteobacteria bacterium]